MGVGSEFCLDVCDEVDILLVSFTLGDELVLDGLLCLTSILVYDIYLWMVSGGVVIFLKISTKLLIDCNLLAPTYENRDVGSEFAIDSIKFSAALVDHS